MIIEILFSIRTNMDVQLGPTTRRKLALNLQNDLSNWLWIGGRISGIYVKAHEYVEIYST